MKNRRNIAAIVFAVVIVLLIALFIWVRRVPSLADSPTTSEQSAVTSQVTNAAVSQNSVATPTQQQINEEKERRWTAAFLTPISVHGKVVDQNGKPIADAKVEIGVNNNPLPNQSGSNYVKTTDDSGRFFLASHGIAYSLRAYKDGYYTTEESAANRNVVSPGRSDSPPSSAENPLVLVLHKQGQTEPLIAKTTGQINVPRTGQPISVDLASGRVGQGDLKIASWVGDYSQRQFDWKYQLSVPGGGIVERKGRFDFEAPEDGYHSSVEINMPASAANWAIDGEGEYFAKLSNGRYARIAIRFYPRTRNFVVIESYINPSAGNRNLEFDPAKVVKSP